MVGGALVTGCVVGAAGCGGGACAAAAAGPGWAFGEDVLNVSIPSISMTPSTRNPSAQYSLPPDARVWLFCK